MGMSEITAEFLTLFNHPFSTIPTQLGEIEPYIPHEVQSLQTILGQIIVSGKSDSRYQEIVSLADDLIDMISVEDLLELRKRQLHCLRSGEIIHFHKLTDKQGVIYRLFTCTPFIIPHFVFLASNEETTHPSFNTLVSIMVRNGDCDELATVAREFNRPAFADLFKTSERFRTFTILFLQRLSLVSDDTGRRIVGVLPLWLKYLIMPNINEAWISSYLQSCIESLAVPLKLSMCGDVFSKSYMEIPQSHGERRITSDAIASLIVNIADGIFRHSKFTTNLSGEITESIIKTEIFAVPSSIASLIWEDYIDRFSREDCLSSDIRCGPTEIVPFGIAIIIVIDILNHLLPNEQVSYDKLINCNTSCESNKSGIVSPIGDDVFIKNGVVRHRYRCDPAQMSSKPYSNTSDETSIDDIKAITLDESESAMDVESKNRVILPPSCGICNNIDDYCCRDNEFYNPTSLADSLSRFSAMYHGQYEAQSFPCERRPLLPVFVPAIQRASIYFRALTTLINIGLYKLSLSPPEKYRDFLESQSELMNQSAQKTNSLLTEVEADLCFNLARLVAKWIAGYYKNNSFDNYELNTCRHRTPIDCRKIMKTLCDLLKLELISFSLIVALLDKFSESVKEEILLYIKEAQPRFEAIPD